MDFMFGENSAADMLRALTLFVGIMIALKLVQVVILRRLKKLAEKTVNNFDDTIIAIFQGIRPPLYFLVALYFGASALTLPDWADTLITIVFVLSVVWELIRAADKVIEYIVNEHIAKSEDPANVQQGKTMIAAFRVVMKIAMWSLGITIALSNIGVDVTSLIAGLGIGGIAVALAAQNILGDIFSSFTIFVDKPFQVGDFIVIGSDSGNVEKIGLKTTRIRTLQGEQLIISNQELTSSRLQNFKRMEHRRVLFAIGVEYGTPTEKMKAIPSIVKELIERVDTLEFDRCHFNAFNASSVDFEVVFYVTSADYNEYMDRLQDVNLALYDRFGKEGIEFAFPTQTIHVKQ